MIIELKKILIMFMNIVLIFNYVTFVNHVLIITSLCYMVPVNKTKECRKCYNQNIYLYLQIGG